MCYNCEGEVDLDVIVCPFCAADLREEKPEQQAPRGNNAATLKNLNTQQSLYPSGASQRAPQKVSSEEESGEEGSPMGAAEDGESKNIVGPTIVMTLGAQLFLFGLLMLFFSHEGAMILKWDARLWYFYVTASIPFLIFGYKSVNKL